MGFEFEELHELRRGATELLGRGFHVAEFCGDSVQGFGQKSWEIDVVAAYADASALEPGLPESGGWILRGNVAADLKGQVDPQSSQGTLSVLLLASSFASLGSDAGRIVDESDGGLDFVAVLPSRPTTAQAFHATLAVKLLDGSCCGMLVVGHLLCLNRGLRTGQDRS